MGEDQKSVMVKHDWGGLNPLREPVGRPRRHNGTVKLEAAKVKNPPWLSVEVVKLVRRRSIDLLHDEDVDRTLP